MGFRVASAEAKFLISPDAAGRTMEMVQTISKLVLAALATWRLTRLLAGSTRREDGFVTVAAPMSDRFLAGSAIDCLTWIGVWMSAQTTTLVVCGFSGLLLNWLVVSGALRLARYSATGLVSLLPQRNECHSGSELCR